MPAAETSEGKLVGDLQIKSQSLETENKDLVEEREEERRLEL